MPRSVCWTAVTMMALAVLMMPLMSLADSLPSSLPHGTERWVVSGVHGQVFVRSEGPDEAPLAFHDIVSPGDEVRVNAQSTVDILVGKRAVLTLEEESTVRFTSRESGYGDAKLVEGTMQVAVSRGDAALRIQTPTATVTTYGGLAMITVRKASTPPAQTADGAADRRWSMRTVDRDLHMETFAVREGRILIQPSVEGSSSLTVEAGQGVALFGGQVGKVRAIAAPPVRMDRLVATGYHADIPSRGLQQIVTREQVEAAQLQQTLLERAEAPELSDQFRNVILSTSVGLPIGIAGQASSSTAPLSGPASGSAPSPGTGISVSPPTSIPPSFTGVILPTSGGGTPATTPPSPSPVILPPALLPSFDGFLGQGKGHGKGKGR